jgi:hypothetical protein
MFKRSHLVGIVLLMSAVAFSVPPSDALAAQGRGRGPDKKAEEADKKAATQDDASAVVVDRDGHVRIVREYARGGSLPPGLAKRESLPPGLREQLHERGALPPGLQKHLIPVPAPLATRLPSIPPYYQRHFAGDDLIVVDTRTNRVVAIIRDIW